MFGDLIELWYDDDDGFDNWLMLCDDPDDTPIAHNRSACIFVGGGN